MEFNNVVFAYPEASNKLTRDEQTRDKANTLVCSSTRPSSTPKNVLNGITFTVKQGKRVALVGASGSGKTTIARLVPRFYDVDGGSVRIGGVDVRDISHKELMRTVSFVFQNPQLIKTTILENIVYGRPEATMEEVNRAVDMAQCREIIDRLPDGLNTVIGTEGTQKAHTCRAANGSASPWQGRCSRMRRSLF